MSLPYWDSNSKKHKLLHSLAPYLASIAGLRKPTMLPAVRRLKSL